MLIFMLILLPLCAAKYDSFFFNVTLVCSQDKLYSFAASFNVRHPNPARVIEEDEIASVNSVGSPGQTHFIANGIYDYITFAPIYEPLIKITHDCFSNDHSGAMVLFVHLPTVPVTLTNSNCNYRVYQDITDKSGAIENSSLVECSD